ncbi:MBL fold metallo-hydrolase [Pokkaliibacter sp. CJK22405]|uniref:MBL fold metallo-hydrolase n=1 Tax=Pokkaliibacter sp. CJK22405 TaxID=3384615 RepID=UPI0039851546
MTSVTKTTKKRPLAALWASLVLLIGGCSHQFEHADPKKPHRTEDGFTNSDGSILDKPFSELMRWRWEAWRSGVPKPPQTVVQGYDFPVEKTDTAWLRANHTQASVTWIGHASALLQLDGFNVLTDPVFSDRASPVSFIGPERKVKVPFPLSELPSVDVVVISHNHYDHLDKASIQQLARQPGGSPLFLVPLGVKAWFADLGITNVQELDWWQDATLDQSLLAKETSSAVSGLKLTFVPAHHWTARGLGDRNQTLWGGWVIQGKQQKVYFAGDSGYSADFAEIGKQLGPFDLALIPVGAYEPRWFMKSQHVDPAEAVQIFNDVHATKAVGIHWGTFELTDEPLDQPIIDLKAALADAQLDPARFKLLHHGATWRWMSDDEPASYDLNAE